MLEKYRMKIHEISQSAASDGDVSAALLAYMRVFTEKVDKMATTPQVIESELESIGSEIFNSEYAEKEEFER